MKKPAKNATHVKAIIATKTTGKLIDTLTELLVLVSWRLDK